MERQCEAYFVQFEAFVGTAPFDRDVYKRQDIQTMGVLPGLGFLENLNFVVQAGACILLEQANDKSRQYL